MDRFILRDGTRVVHYQYEGETDVSPLLAVTNAVADAADVSPSDLPPIYEFVDPDAIHSLFHKDRGTHDDDTLLRFLFEDWTVFVGATGHIRVCGGPHHHFTVEFGPGGVPIASDQQRELN